MSSVNFAIPDFCSLIRMYQLARNFSRHATLEEDEPRLLLQNDLFLKHQ